MIKFPFYDPKIAPAITETARRIMHDARAACPYCIASDGSAIMTGLPGNACENCMNIGYADPAIEDLQK